VGVIISKNSQPFSKRGLVSPLTPLKEGVGSMATRAIEEDRARG